MTRWITCCFAFVALFGLMLAADGQEKTPTASFSGKIADVNLDAAKKVESIYIQVGKNRRNVRITDKTKFTWGQIKEADQQLKVGQNAAVVINAETNDAITIKITAGATKK